MGEQEKRVYRNELDEFLSRGWEVGTSAHHKQRLSSSHTGISPWNKGTTGVMKKNQTSFGKGHAPWNKGTKGAQVGWSKGLTKETDVRVMKYALSNKENWKTNTKRKLALIEVNKSLKGRKLTPSQKEHFLKSSYDTKLRNNTFNSSSQEE